MERTGDLGGAWDWDLRTGTGSWSLDAARLFGTNRSASPVTLETWQACVHPGDRGRAADRLIEAIVTQASYQDEFRIVAFDDRVRWLRSLGVTAVDPAGRPARMVGFTTDITRQRDRSGAGRSGVGGGSETLEMIRRSIRFRNHLVSDVLDAEAVLMGRLTIKPAAIELGPIVRRVADNMQVEANAAGVVVTLLEGPGRAQVLADASRVEQMAWNLLSNAIKFTPAGGRVWVRVSATLRAARLEVADTGRGFDPEGPSPGVGLAIVGHLVELHGGVVSATSVGKGHGATFVVELPLMLPPSRIR
jgi:signal transduction histidine kinase